MKKLDIKLTDVEYTCGDGCCYEWYVRCEINNEKIDNFNFTTVNNILGSLETVLTHLGYDVNIEILPNED